MKGLSTSEIIKPYHDCLKNPAHLKRTMKPCKSQWFCHRPASFIDDGLDCWPSWLLDVFLQSLNPFPLLLSPLLTVKSLPSFLVSEFLCTCWIFPSDIVHSQCGKWVAEQRPAWQRSFCYCCQDLEDGTRKKNREHDCCNYRLKRGKGRQMLKKFNFSNRLECSFVHLCMAKATDGLFWYTSAWDGSAL